MRRSGLLDLSDFGLGALNNVLRLPKKNELQIMISSEENAHD
jgi:hypothetical protein